MAFFKRNQKKLALTCDRQSLERAYHISEDNLKKHLKMEMRNGLKQP